MQWDPAASSSAGKMMRTAVESCHPRPGRGARRDEGGGGIHRNRRLVLDANKLAGGLATLPFLTSSSSSPPC